MNSKGSNMAQYLRGEREIKSVRHGRTGVLDSVNGEGIMKVKILTADGVNQVFYINKKNLDKYQDKHGSGLEVLG